MNLTGLGSVFDFGSKIIDKLFPDPAQRDEAKFKLLQLQDQGELREFDTLIKSDENQTEVLVKDAGSDKFIQYGWRPYIGWICGTGLAYQFILRPILTWTALMFDGPVAPPLELDTLISLLAGMLGLAGMRHIEKLRK